MANDGKSLEEFVAYVERHFASGFEVKTNKKEYADDGTQLAEFDVEVSGKVGTGSIKWLIECRSRPRSGPAGAEWVQQIHGRQVAFNFNKATAVSTTGFTIAARDMATRLGVELREVKALQPADVATWLPAQTMDYLTNVADLQTCQVFVADDAPEEVKTAVIDILKNPPKQGFLRRKATGTVCEASEAFLHAVTEQKLFANSAPEDCAREVELHVEYTNPEDHYVIDTNAGPARVTHMVFRGALYTISAQVPFTDHSGYQSVGGKETYAQRASVKHTLPDGQIIALEFRHLGGDEKTHVLLRAIPAKTRN